ncbi:hypothetical protein [Mycetocola saprophilus]|uniref:hypothetical protein n=1 Tax=Mycetocola saprophilus TaxID=76636 RepID=UPI003BEFE150
MFRPSAKSAVRIGAAAISVLTSLTLFAPSSPQFAVSASAATSPVTKLGAAPSITLAADNRVGLDPRLDPGTIGLCNAGLGDVSVKNYDAVRLGNIDLLCGDERDGYVHIRKKHEKEWQSLMDSLGGGGTWDDLMEMALSSSVTNPGPGYPIDIGSGKYCYSTPVQIFHSDGSLIRVINPTIIVSANNKKVITAVPTTDAVSSNCRTVE